MAGKKSKELLLAEIAYADGRASMFENDDGDFIGSATDGPHFGPQNAAEGAQSTPIDPNELRDWRGFPPGTDAGGRFVIGRSPVQLWSSAPSSYSLFMRVPQVLDRSGCNLIDEWHR